MGEIAEMVINGLLCQKCGGWMEDMEEPGYPRTCQYCKQERKQIKRSPLKRKGD